MEATYEVRARSRQMTAGQAYLLARQLDELGLSGKVVWWVSWPFWRQTAYRFRSAPKQEQQ